MGSPSETTLVIVSVMIGFQTVHAFLTQGGVLLSPSSVALYGLLVFGIFPAVYAALEFRPFEHRTSIQSLIITVILIGLLQWIILTICPTRKLESRNSLSVTFDSNAAPFAAFLLAFTMLFQLGSVPFLPAATGLCSIFFAAFSMAVANSTYRLFSSFTLLMASASYYALFIFTGFGRLNLAAMGIGVLILLSLRYSGNLIKTGLLAVTTPAIILLSDHRVTYLEETRGTDISFDEGIGSIVGPFISGSIIVDRMLDGLIEPSLGTTLFSALVVWIPSNFWPGKPPGFGSEMVYITQPHLTNVSAHSSAGLITGEAVWNFGVAGSVFMFLLLAIWIRFLDKWYVGFAAKIHEDPGGIAQACYGVLIAALSSGVLNIIWGGWHTYTARLFVVVALLLAFLVFFNLSEGYGRKRRISGAKTFARRNAARAGNDY